MQPQRAVFRSVVDELPLPGEKSLVFKSPDGLACTETHIAGKNIHQVCPSSLLFDWAGFSGFWDRNNQPSSFRGARSASPESITTTGIMDSGPAPKGASRNDEGV